MKSWPAKRLLVRGAGEMASGVIRRLCLAGFEVLALEQPNPSCIRRTICFAEAIWTGDVTIENVTGVAVASVAEAHEIIARGSVAIMVDSEASCAPLFSPGVLVDARMLKDVTNSSFDLAPLVIGVGPGFDAGTDCHAVVESNRGFHLGRVIYKGKAEPNTGTPAVVDSVGEGRILRAPAAGAVESEMEIGRMVTRNQRIGSVDGTDFVASIGGCLRGLIRPGTQVSRGQKIGDIDPRGVREYCFLISEKANAIAGGVLEAVLCLSRTE